MVGDRRRQGKIVKCWKKKSQKSCERSFPPFYAGGFVKPWGREGGRGKKKGKSRAGIGEDWAGMRGTYGEWTGQEREAKGRNERVRSRQSESRGMKGGDGEEWKT